MAGQSRRDLLKITAAAAIAGPLAAADSAPKFFTAEEFQMVDDLAELIVPADGHSPGAHAAQVAGCIDRRLAESLEPEAQQLWKTGLRRIDALSNELNGKAWAAAGAGERLAVLGRAALNEANPKLPEEIFFRELKTRTVHAYYTSKIGIHQEMEYKGNSYLDEFVG